MIMRKLLRSKEEKCQLKAAEIVMRYGPHLALKESAAAVELSQEDRDWLDSKNEFDRQRLKFNSVHGLPAEDEEAFYRDLDERMRVPEEFQSPPHAPSA